MAKYLAIKELDLESEIEPKTERYIVGVTYDIPLFSRLMFIEPILSLSNETFEDYFKYLGDE